MLIKLLENPLTVSILHLLAKKPLTILQITKNLESDTASIFAILGELHQYGLVLQIKNNKLNDSTSSSNKTDSKEKIYNNNQLSLQNTSMGIPLTEYLKLWEEIQLNPGDSNPDMLNKYLFSIPNHLRSILKNGSHNKIRNKILRRITK
jgi:hypothetical protein